MTPFSRIVFQASFLAAFLLLPGCSAGNSAPAPPSSGFQSAFVYTGVGTRVSFTDTSAGGPNGWAWTFGDGATSNLQNPVHSYSAAGSYQVTLAASCPSGPAALRPELPVVFVSAHAEQAVGAFEVEAVDFLIKPVTTERLVKALDRVRQRLGRNRPAAAHPGRYPVFAGSGVLLLDLARTGYFEVVDQVVWAVAGERFRTRWKSLGEVVANFPDAGLLRIHRHLLVRPEAILGLRSTGGGTRVMVRLAGGAELEASRGATPELKERLGLM